MSDKPVSITKISRTREVRWTMPESVHKAAILIYLHKNYPNFRGFKNDEYDVDFLEDGTVKIYACKESNESK